MGREGETRISTRSFSSPSSFPPSRGLYRRLVDVEEHPEASGLVRGLVERWLEDGGALPVEWIEGSRIDLEALGGHLESRAESERPWRVGLELQRRALHYLVQLSPTIRVDGCWLQGGPRVANAATLQGALLTRLYIDHLDLLRDDGPGGPAMEFRTLCSQLGLEFDELARSGFDRMPNLLDFAWALPVYLLGLGQFPQAYGPELLGCHFAWVFLGLRPFMVDLLQDVATSYGRSIPLLAESVAETDRRRRGLLEVLRQGLPPASGRESRLRFVRGAGALVALWDAWLIEASSTAPEHALDPTVEMLELLDRKAPLARGYHREHRLAGRRLDDYFADEKFDGAVLLRALAGSRWVVPGAPEESPLIHQLLQFGGPMMDVFSPIELQVIERWIASLPESLAGVAERTLVASTPRSVAPARFSDAEFDQAGERFRAKAREFEGCRARKLFHALVNVEQTPWVLPAAEQYARARLERSLAGIWDGRRPIPARRFDAEALKEWVLAKHRAQVDSYRPPDQCPRPSREELIESTVQLAPTILIDGAWLQGIASPALIHTEVGRMLAHVFLEEIGEGRVDEHHANIYRELLQAMGEELPSVDSREFAESTRLHDASFDVPTLWLSISCFPRHFLPELLGLNLAVELAGVGGPYMEARDVLRHYGFPTLFVDVHNAADNVSVGHSAWALEAIVRYLEEVALRHGPSRADLAWQRVWSGVRVTVPEGAPKPGRISRWGRARVGGDHRGKPQIFPV